jgi:AraC-like DNA-binding protein
VSEVFHASYTDHAYPVHCHDTWTVLIVDSGLVRYELANHERGADTQHVTVLPPFVAHDGRSARTGRGFTKRVLYIDTATINENLVGAAVDHSTLDDAPLRRSISRLHDLLVRPADDLEEESRLAIIVERITTALQHTTFGSERTPAHAAESLRAALDEDPFARHSLNDIASRLGWNPTHLIRSFTNEYGLPPHRYLISRRIDEARRQLLAGVPAATVALNVGFHDQAHLSRHFKNHLSTTPGRYQRAPSPRYSGR